MSGQKRLIVDVSSLCWTSLFYGQDLEFSYEVEFEGKTVQVIGWQHGYDNAVNWLIDAWNTLEIAPKDTIMVYESGNSKGFRKRMLECYKESRATRPAQAYEEFNTLKAKLIEVVTGLGGQAVTRQHIEADDVIAYLTQTLEGFKFIMSQDKDMAVLMSDDTLLWRDGQIVVDNPIGDFPTSWVTIYKSLVGDSSDKIPGAKGFGGKAWEKLIELFGQTGINAMTHLIQTKQLGELSANVDEFKPLQKIIDDAENVYASYAAAKMYPELCTEMRVPLEWKAGYVKPATEFEDDRLHKYAGITWLVDKDNFKDCLNFLHSELPYSDWVSLDLETFTSMDSDEWCETSGITVDVHDSTIAGMGITFGKNQQYNLYFSVNHKDTNNITLEDLRRVLDSIPADKTKVIANFAGFEAIVLRNTFGDLHGSRFLPNVIDVQLEAAYVNENTRRGLEALTKHYIGVDQLSYAEVTQGRKMNQLTGQEVLAYGSGDTLFTSALHNHFNIIMELEGTAKGFEENENDCQYAIALGFLNGIKFDFGKLLQLEKEDLESEAKAQRVLNHFLIKHGWEGTVCPVYTAEDLLVPAKLKEIYQIVTGEELKTMVRTPEKLYALIGSQDHEDASLIAKLLSDENLKAINDLVASRFDGTPVFNTGSTVQVRKFLYDVCNLPVRLLNNLTDNERKNQKLSQAYWRFSDIQKGEKVPPLTRAEKELIKVKATTDKHAIAFALKYDAQQGEVHDVLKAFSEIKEIETRKSLFYEPWKKLLYWKDRKMYPSVRQSSTTSLRFTASKPNVTQLARRGEGVKMRSCFVPHKKNAIVVSLDLNAQELRLQAVLSQDQAFMSCYVGDNKKDIHSLTGAAIEGITYEEFMAGRRGERAAYFNGVRNEKGKPTNFLSAYGGTEHALHKNLVQPLQDAKEFLEAKRKTFPRYEEWQAEQQAFAKRHGYVEIPGGARRHVAHVMKSGSNWEINAAARSAGNAPIQGGSAAQLKRALGKMYRRGVFDRYDAHFYMPVHDEVVFSVVIEDAFEAIKEVHGIMTETFVEGMPVVSSIAVGHNYGELIEVEGDTFDEVANTLTNTLDKLRSEL